MSERMNVLIIITDQQRSDQMSCAGNHILKTPNIDSIGNNGMRFTNYFCTTPICMPNRASFFTGTYPSVHGTRSNGINLDPNIPTISEILRIQGFHTASIGKLHFNFYAPSYRKKVKSLENIQDWMLGKIKSPFPTPYYGFDEVILTTGHGDVCSGTYIEWLEEKQYEKLDFLKNRMRAIFEYYYDTVLPENLYPTAYITERTLAFLERYSKGDYSDKPFFLNISYTDPHHPVCPPGKYFDMYKAEDIELPANFNDIKNVKEHKFLKPRLNNPFFRGMVLRITTEKEARDFIAATYGSIAMIDDSIGQVLATLKKLNLIDNTIVIYTSDHGDLMGDHGMILKGPCPYDGILRVPLIWKVPGVSQPGITEALASSVDISKTILKLLKIPEKTHPPDLQGVDLTPVLEDPSTKVRDHCLVEHDEEIEMLKINVRVRHFITEDYKLTVYNGLQGYGDLFDRKNDPDEINNLWYDKNYQDLRHKLMEQLFHANLNAQSHYPKREAMS